MSALRSNAAFAAALLATLVAPLGALADTLPPGGTIDKALGVDVSQKGVDFMVSQGLSLVPDKIVVPDVNDSASCGFDNFSYSIYQGDPTNGIHVAITTAQVSPADGGYLDLAVGGTINGTGTDTAGPGGSTQSNVFTRLEYDGCFTNCRMPDNFSVLRFTQAMPFSVVTKIYLSLTVDGQGVPHVTATSPISRNDITLDPTKLDAAGCNAADFLTAVGKYFITDPIKDQIIQQVNDTLLPQIAAGLEQAKVDQDVALAGTTLHIKMQPSGFVISHDGIVLDMSSAIDAAQPTSCVPVGANAGSLLTPGDMPAFGSVSPQGIAFDAAAGVSDDLVNQALFAAWHGGLLCQTIDSLGAGTPLDTSLLAVAGLSGALGKLGVPDGTPVLIVIKAYQPPTGDFGGGHDVNIHAKKVEISIFTEVQERTARIVALDLDATASVDLSVDPATSQLSVALNLDPANLVGSIAYDEPVGDAADGLIGFLPTLAGTLGPQLAGAIPTIDLSNLGGVSLTDTEFDPQQGVGGSPNDTLSLYTALAAAPGGCNASGTGGCGISGGGSCDVVSSPRARNTAGVMALFALTPLAFVLRRRRRSR